MNARIVLFLGKREGMLEEQEKHYVLPAGTTGTDADEHRFLLPWKILVGKAKEAVGDERVRIQIVVVGSAKTWEAWEEQLHPDAEKAGFGDRNTMPIGFLQYDETMFNLGAGDRYWSFFHRLGAVLGGDPCADVEAFRCVENSPQEPFRQSCGHVVVDITRGWRALPIVGSAALAFARADDRRRTRPELLGQHAKTGQQRAGHQLFYAALDEAKDQGTDVVPVWDLTRAVEAVELSDALDAFASHGIADDLAAFFEQADLECARQIAAPMRRFSDDLLLMRIPYLLQCSAPRLQQALSQHLEPLKGAFPPVARELADFAEQIDRLAPNGEIIDPVSKAGLRSLVELAERLRQTNRRAELFSLLREGLLTAFSLIAIDGEIHQPEVDCERRERSNVAECPKWEHRSRGSGSKFGAQRREVDNCWQNWLAQLQSRKSKQLQETEHVTLRDDPKTRSQAQRILEQVREIAQLRNDVAHFMVANPREEAELRTCLEEQLADFKALVGGLS